MQLGLLAAIAVFAVATPLRGEAPRDNVTDTIQVIATAPFGAARDADRIPANVQSATGEQIRDDGALDLADFLKRNLGSVFVNDAQNNPLQPDVQYRGFVGSPLLGLPQGLAVYLDGVRINEPFGDTVNWALIPESAIETVTLMPGSNPLFGLNALGGALAIRTRTGLTSPGTRAEVQAGSFGRIGLQADTGGATGEGFNYFLTGSWFDEDGWRDYSASRAKQFFANLGSTTGRTTLNATLTYVDTDLTGNGAAPVQLLDESRRAIFTRPDQTRNELALMSITASNRYTDALSFTGNVYFRDSDISTYNGDNSDFSACTGTPGFICQGGDGGEALVLDGNGDPIAAEAGVQGATVNRTTTDQRSIGFTLQAAWTAPLLGRDNQLTVGLVHDSGRVGFTSSTELGSLDATRLAVPGGVFAGESLTHLDASIGSTGLYVTDSFGLTEKLSLTLSGRFNDTRVQLEDRLGDDLNGEHTFERFNPAAGLTAAIARAVTFYAGYSESNRAPSPVELTCADEDDPCRLPNAFVADPPLEQVVAKTLEAGFRGTWHDATWHVGGFRTINDDDILFISAGSLTNEGYFANVGRTRREGIELNLSGKAGPRVDWFANYTFLDATFRSAFAVQSPNNPAAVNGEIAVEPGDRLPLIPERVFKVGLRLAVAPAVSLGATVLGASNQFFRGDEANLVEPLDGYAVLNLRGEWRINPRTGVFLTVDNALNSRYETFGVFADSTEVLGEDFDDPRFVGPGAPRAAWLGIRVEFQTLPQ